MKEIAKKILSFPIHLKQKGLALKHSALGPGFLHLSRHMMATKNCHIDPASG